MTVLRERVQYKTLSDRETEVRKYFTPLVIGYRPLLSHGVAPHLLYFTPHHASRVSLCKVRLVTLKSRDEDGVVKW